MHSKKTPINVVSCGSIVYRKYDGKPQILLVKPWKDRDVWGIPKGHVDHGETYEQAALRETYEETGLRVELEDKLPDCRVDYKGEHKLVLTWMAHQIGDEAPRTSDPDGEIVDVRFFNVDNLPRVHVYQQAVVAAAAIVAAKKVESCFFSS